MSYLYLQNLMKEQLEKKEEISLSMYLTSLEVENVKCFGSKQKLALTDSNGVISPWTLILGDNGVGKTTLLKCLAWMAPVEAPEKEREAIDRLKIEIASILRREGIDNEIISYVTDISVDELDQLLIDEKKVFLVLDDFEKVAVEKEKILIAKKLKIRGVNIAVINRVTGIESKNLELLDQKIEEKRIEIKPFMDEFEDEKIFESLVRVGENVKTRIEATFSNGVQLNEIPASEKLITVGIDLEKINGDLVIISPIKHEVRTFLRPKMYAFGASRHMSLKNFDKPELKDPVSNLFSDSSDLYDAEQLLSDLNYSSIQEKIKRIESKENGNESNEKGKEKLTSLLSSIKIILKDLLLDIESTDSFIFNPPFNDKGEKNENLVEIITPYGKVSLNSLSLGYKTMLSFIVELALRMFWENPENDKPLESPGIVIIDEIDLHLHPKWQRVVREYLTHHFPKVQFICTAHSPFMAQASEDENLCVIHRVDNEVKIENDPFIVKGWRIGQIATSNLFGVPSERSPDIEDLYNQQNAILDKVERNAKDEEDLARIEEQLSELPITENPDDQKLLEEIKKMIQAG